MKPIHFLKNLFRRRRVTPTDDRELTKEEMSRAVFRIGEQVPLKGRWWVVTECRLRSVRIVPVGPTGKNR